MSNSMKRLPTLAMLGMALSGPSLFHEAEGLEPLTKRPKPGRVETLKAQLAKLKPGTHRYDKIKARLEKAERDANPFKSAEGVRHSDFADVNDGTPIALFPDGKEPE